MSLTKLERQILDNDGKLAASIKPHPDGKAWDTCCRVGDKNSTFNPHDSDSSTTCQCFVRKPPHNISRYEQFLVGLHDRSCPGMKTNLMAAASIKARFFCCHRTTDDGYHRECAGWAAKITKNPTI